MSQEIVVQPQPRAWLENSVLQPYVSRYGAHLRRGRYAPSTQRVYLCCVAHFAHWLTGERCGLPTIGEAVVARFLSEHLPACGCPYPVRRLRHELRAALVQLLEVLRADGVGAMDPALDTAVAQELARFDAHMRDVWGLADNTRRQRGRIIGEFLLAHFEYKQQTSYLSFGKANALAKSRLNKLVNALNFIASYYNQFQAKLDTTV